jgi:hypothetical protein
MQKNDASGTVQKIKTSRITEQLPIKRINSSGMSLKWLVNNKRH